MKKLILLAMLIAASLNAKADYVKYPQSGGGGGGSWGLITGSLPNQTDLQTALNAKLPYFDYKILHPDGNTGGYNYSDQQPQLKPLQNSPDESWNMWQRIVNIDPDSTGFNIGTNGNFGNIFNIGFNHQGTSSIGNASLFNTYSSFGNGTDPFSLKGYQMMLGFGNINSGVTVTDSIQGYGFQMNIASGSTLGASSYITGFYDNMNINTTAQGYQSFNSSPYIKDVATNHQAVSYNANPTIDKLTGNAGYTAFAMAGTFGATSLGASSGINGMNLNPTITNFGAGNYYNGIYSSTAGITGAGTNKWAGYFDGDVNINGSLSFSGALSIGKLSAYASQPVIDGGGNPSTIHGLISDMTIAANATTANADTLGVNTAALIHVGDNSTTTSGPLSIGLTGLALPAVIETGTGSSIDFIGGAAFALNFSGTSTGGTLNQGYGGMFVPIPNGITTVNRWYGVWSRAPFGNVATDNWGIYAEDTEKNYMEGALKIGGTDTPTAGMKLDVDGNTKLAGTVKVGANGNALTNIFAASATLDFPSTGPNDYSDLTMTVTGAIDGDVCSVGVKNSEVYTHTLYFCWVSANDTVTIRFSNEHSGAHDPASAIYKVSVTQF